MRVWWAAGAVAAALACSAQAQAASFDCRNASTRVEKLICADAGLSRLDDELALAFKDALALTPRPVATAAAQRAWLRERDAAPNSQAVDEAYRFRLQALNAERTIDRRGRRPIPHAELKRSCVPVGFACEIESAGEVPGSRGELYYQLQRSIEDDPDLTDGVVVFAPEGRDRLVPILWVHDSAERGAPEVVGSPAGPLLVLPGWNRGSGHFNEHLVFRRAGERWRDVDVEAWKADLHRRLPGGRHVAKGVEYDFRKLTAETPVWGERDANCCPEAGYARIALALQGDRLVLRRLDYDPAEAGR